MCDSMCTSLVCPHDIVCVSLYKCVYICVDSLCTLYICVFVPLCEHMCAYVFMSPACAHDMSLCVVCVYIIVCGQSVHSCMCLCHCVTVCALSTHDMHTQTSIHSYRDTHTISCAHAGDMNTYICTRVMCVCICITECDV